MSPRVYSISFYAVIPTVSFTKTIVLFGGESQSSDSNRIPSYVWPLLKCLYRISKTALLRNGIIPE